ncbi:MAG: serine--tRNA ligase [Patescibacteria group bacterium]|nr:serine--tRNA ligase [Patescibacteria group bacterium]
MKLRDLLDQDKFNEVQTALKRRGFEGGLSKLIELEKKRVEITPKLDEMRAEANKLAKAKDIEGGKKISGELKELEAEYKDLVFELTKLTAEIPNIPDSDIPDGGEDDGKVLETAGYIPKIDNPKDHTELGKNLDIIDLERGTKVSGSRFYYLKNQAVELEFALIRYVSKILGERGFEFLMGPQLLGERAMLAGGYLGKAIDEIYKTQDNLYLNGTSEPAILAYHMDEIIEVPKRYAAFSTCFRREAGSYGKDTKGIIRTHQFDKVEMFAFVAPEDSDDMFETMNIIIEDILKGLEIPYQKVLLAAGDLGAAASKTVDYECWLPSQNKYRETHSVSMTTDWQANLANVRYKAESGNENVYTLNGTAVAIGRMIAVLLENHQQEDGSIKIPQSLHPYLGFKEISSR